jgi:hypothetical protein
MARLQRQLLVRDTSAYGLVHVAIELVDGVVEGDKISQSNNLRASNSKVENKVSFYETNEARGGGGGLVCGWVKLALWP